MPSSHDASSPRRRILIAEDSSVTRDLLKLLLTQRGHEVDLVGDGEAALKSLQSSPYDVALIDFHLPKLSGLKVAKEFIAALGDKSRRPRLIAMTADVEGLLADPDNCEVFDFTVPKPLDIYAIGKVVEDRAPAIEVDSGLERPAVKSGAEPAEAPWRRSEKSPSPIESLGVSYLHWPEDFSRKRLAAHNWATAMAEERVDAILVHEPVEAAALSAVWRTNPLFLAPIIDLTGHLGARADVNAAALSINELNSVVELINAFHRRRPEIHPDFLHSDDLSEKLLARIAVAGGSLSAFHAPDAREFVGHGVCLDPETVRNESQKLAASGLLAPTFFDRLQACAQCGSSRLIVREVCPKCRSANLREEPYLHHFKCAFQGPESDFRRGDDLVCPKCRRTLTHFSVDYDKPGFMCVCEACANAASEAIVAFTCVDCGARAEADAVETRNVFSYDVTARGRAFLEAGRAFLGQAERSLRFAEFPLDLVVALNAEARRYNEEKAPFTLVNLSYQNLRPLEREFGHRQVSQARELFLENFGNAIAGDKVIVRGQLYDFALLKGENRSDAAPRLEKICVDASRTLRLDLGVVARAYGPEDFV
ncbi:MAG: response regulator [Parvularculaceae bacterium]